MSTLKDDIESIRKVMETVGHAECFRVGEPTNIDRFTHTCLKLLPGMLSTFESMLKTEPPDEALYDDRHLRLMRERDKALDERDAALAEVARLTRDIDYMGEVTAERKELREMLAWLDRGGGLGLRVHEKIRALLSVGDVP